MYLYDTGAYGSYVDDEIIITTPVQIPPALIIKLLVIKLHILNYFVNFYLAAGKINMLLLV